MSVVKAVNRRLVTILPLSLKKRIVVGLRRKAFRRWRMQRTADVMLVSFPKSGRTWLRLMIGRTFEQHWMLDNFSLLDLWALGDFDPALPRILVSHEHEPHKQKAWAKRQYRNKKVILLVRDPRDIIVSWYFQANKRNLKYSGDLPTFLDPADGRIDRIVRYFNGWAEHRSVPRDFLLVRYEDLQADTVGELRRVFDFLGFPGISNDELQAAAAHGSFNNMRQLERENALNVRRLMPRDAQDEESYKTRKGKVGGYADYLQDHEIRYLNSRIDGVLHDMFGYASHAPRP